MGIADQGEGYLTSCGPQHINSMTLIHVITSKPRQLIKSNRDLCKRFPVGGMHCDAYRDSAEHGLYSDSWGLHSAVQGLHSPAQGVHLNTEVLVRPFVANELINQAFSYIWGVT